MKGRTRIHIQIQLHVLLLRVEFVVGVQQVVASACEFRDDRYVRCRGGRREYERREGVGMIRRWAVGSREDVMNSTA